MPIWFCRLSRSLYLSSFAVEIHQLIFVCCVVFGCFVYFFCCCNKWKQLCFEFRGSQLLEQEQKKKRKDYLPFKNKRNERRILLLRRIVMIIENKETTYNVFLNGSSSDGWWWKCLRWKWRSATKHIRTERERCCKNNAKREISMWGSQ